MSMILTKEQILALIPQQNPFRFIDELELVDSESCRGNYLFKSDEYFYEGHFPEKPITPGVIVTEAMAQIGLIPLGIYLLAEREENLKPEDVLPVFSSSHVDFLSPIYPGEKLIVEAVKVYFRFGKLKAKITATKENGDKVCKGEFSGMFIDRKKI